MASIKDVRVSSSNCDNTFRTIIRQNGDTVKHLKYLFLFIQKKYRECLRISYDRKLVKKFINEAKTDIFNDKYKLVENEKKIEKKFVENYVKGNLKSNATTLPSDGKVKIKNLMLKI